MVVRREQRWQAVGCRRSGRAGERDFGGRVPQPLPSPPSLLACLLPAETVSGAFDGAGLALLKLLRTHARTYARTRTHARTHARRRRCGLVYMQCANRRASIVRQRVLSVFLSPSTPPPSFPTALSLARALSLSLARPPQTQPLLLAGSAGAQDARTRTRTLSLTHARALTHSHKQLLASSAGAQDALMRIGRSGAGMSEI